CAHLELADRQGAPRLQDAAGRHQLLAIGRRQEIDLELGGQHRAVRRKQGEAGITARRIRNGAGDPGMEEAVLLRQLLLERELDGDEPGLDPGEARADEMHHLLAAEAVAHARREIGIARLEAAAHSQDSGSLPLWRETWAS